MGGRAFEVLVVDDSRFIRRSVELLLARAGYQVKGVSTGPEALGYVQSNHPDLIILDLMLPEITGTEVLRRLKEAAHSRDIPVVVLSGLSKCNEGSLMNIGASAFCEKEKLESGTLLAVVGSLLPPIVSSIPAQE